MFRIEASYQYAGVQAREYLTGQWSTLGQALKVLLGINIRPGCTYHIVEV